MQWISIENKEKIPHCGMATDIWITDGAIIIRGCIINGEIESDECDNEELESMTHWIREEDVPMPIKDK